MILDSDGDACQKVNFNIGTTTATTRQWTIQVSQYNCGMEEVSGPPGCLQYYTATTGTIQKYFLRSLEICHEALNFFDTPFSYGFPTSITSSSKTVSATVTHLANQHYGDL